jgi:hypothetical protein
MPKSLLSDKTTRRPKEPFDPALEDPIALTPDHLETVVGGLVCVGRGVGDIATTGIGGATFGIVAPPQKPPSSFVSFDKL